MYLRKAVIESRKRNKTLICSHGHLLMLMERQMHPGTEAEWLEAGAE